MKNCETGRNNSSKLKKETEFKINPIINYKINKRILPSITRDGITQNKKNKIRRERRIRSSFVVVSC